MTGQHSDRWTQFSWSGMTLVEVFAAWVAIGHQIFG